MTTRATKCQDTSKRISRSFSIASDNVVRHSFKKKQVQSSEIMYMTFDWKMDDWQPRVSSSFLSLTDWTSRPTVMHSTMTAGRPSSSQQGQRAHPAVSVSIKTRLFHPVLFTTTTFFPLVPQPKSQQEKIPFPDIFFLVHLNDSN